MRLALSVTSELVWPGSDGLICHLVNGERNDHAESHNQKTRNCHEGMPVYGPHILQNTSGPFKEMPWRN